MKKVLFLTYYFPPRNRISSFRIAGFCRYLPELGWEPTVICEDWPTHAPDYDNSLLEGLQDLVIHRIKSYKPSGLERLLVRNFYPWVYPDKTPYNWWKLALKNAFEVCSQNKFDAIVGSHDPLATLKIAQALSKDFRIPWVADLRDSWNVQTLSSPRKQKLIASCELELCKDADRVVTVSGEIATRLELLTNKKIHVVENGFDEIENFTSQETKVQGTVFSIIYAGNLAPCRNPVTLLKALKQCIDEKKITKDLIEVHFLGVSASSIPEHRLKEFSNVPIRFSPRVPRNDAIRQMCASSLLWVIPHPHEKGVLTGKIFDYLSTERPIIAVPDDKGEINQLLAKTKAGCSLGNHQEIMAKILEFYERWKVDPRFKLDADKSEIMAHSRQQRTEKLAKVLNSLNQKN
jgi:glycosyltransferase involved in cell wall biosynthesis